MNRQEFRGQTLCELREEFRMPLPDAFFHLRDFGQVWRNRAIVVDFRANGLETKLVAVQQSQQRFFHCGKPMGQPLAFAELVHLL